MSIYDNVARLRQLAFEKNMLIDEFIASVGFSLEDIAVFLQQVYCDPRYTVAEKEEIFIDTYRYGISDVFRDDLLRKCVIVDHATNRPTCWAVFYKKIALTDESF